MRISTSSKATGLLVLMCLQYTFAAVDVSLCSGPGLCYPAKGKYGNVRKSCPESFTLGKDASGKDVCVRKVALPCPQGTSLGADGKCCGKTTQKKCSPLSGLSCPSGTVATKDCPSLPSGNPAARKLLEADNPLIKEVNIVGTNYVPNVILPKPAISFNIAPPPKRDPPKINIPSFQMPQIILPEPAVSVSVPEIPKVGPEVKWVGSGSLIPNIIPILPEPPVTLEVPEDAFPSAVPKVNTNMRQKVVTLDLSKVGPSHTVDVNLPAFPDVAGEVMRLPDIDVNLPDLPKVVDLSHLGPSTTLNITLPKVTLPKQGSITVVNSNPTTPQYLDLTHLSGSTVQHNIVLPSTKTHGAVLNVIVDDHNNGSAHNIVLPGDGNTHHTTINVPEVEHPQKDAKLVVDIKANPALLREHVTPSRTKNVTKINLKLPDIDLSKALPAGHDVVVDLKPLLLFNKTRLGLSDTAPKPTPLPKVDIKMKDIEIPRLMNDTTILIKPAPIDLKRFIPASLLNRADSKEATTETVINLPNNTLTALPVPAGKTDVGVHIPLKLGLAKSLNGSAAPDATIDVFYQQKWSGGAETLPNPGARVANPLGKAINAMTTAGCPTACCSEEEVDGCLLQEFKLETVSVEVACDKGCTYDLKADACLCSPGGMTGCPGGTTRCSLGGKGVCVAADAVEGATGAAACATLKAVCAAPGLMAKSCASA